MPNPKATSLEEADISTRRAHDHLHPLSLAECPNCHEKKLPHRACPKCGYYNGREVIDTEAKTA